MKTPLARALSIRERINEWIALSDDAMRLRCGEMTAQEIRTVRAVLNAINVSSAGKLSLAPMIEKDLKCQRSVTGRDSQPEPDQVAQIERLAAIPKQVKDTPIGGTNAISK